MYIYEHELVEIKGEIQHHLVLEEKELYLCFYKYHYMNTFYSVR